MKTAADWKTGINSLKNVRGSLAADSGGRGLNYKEYLQIMVFLLNQDILTTLTCIKICPERMCCRFFRVMLL